MTNAEQIKKLAEDNRRLRDIAADLMLEIAVKREQAASEQPRTH